MHYKKLCKAHKGAKKKDNSCRLPIHCDKVKEKCLMHIFGITSPFFLLDTVNFTNIYDVEVPSSMKAEFNKMILKSIYVDVMIIFSENAACV